MKNVLSGINLYNPRPDSVPHARTLDRRFREPLQFLLEEEVLDENAAAFDNLNDDAPRVEQLKTEMACGKNFSDLVEVFPEAVLAMLGRFGLRKVGYFYEKGTVVYRAFSDKMILTLGETELKVDDAKDRWRNYFAERGVGGNLNNSGKTQPVKLLMYSSNIRNASAAKLDGLIDPLLEMEKTCSKNMDVWDFPLVQAVIEHKWHYWAKAFVTFEFILYLGWAISYVVFLLFYIELENQDRKLNEYRGLEQARALMIFIFDILATAFMIPFATFEMIYLKHKGWKGIDMWCTINLTAILFQSCIMIIHCTRWWFNSNAFILQTASSLSSLILISIHGKKASPVTSTSSNTNLSKYMNPVLLLPTILIPDPSRNRSRASFR